MHLSKSARPEYPQTRIVWRFFADSSHQWKWQQLAFDGTIVANSKSSYLQYEACVSNASKHGYLAAPAKARGGSPNTGQLPVSPFRAVFEHRENTPAEESIHTGSLR
ncbi:MAG: hypothetical protein IH604_16960 [Burkholderiales bacterium]|nr:hypothetical protein [Burkholderiales bacterium]